MVSKWSALMLNDFDIFCLKKTAQKISYRIDILLNLFLGQFYTLSVSQDEWEKYRILWKSWQWTKLFVHVFLFFNILLLHSGLVCKLVVEEAKSREDIKSLLFCKYGAFHLKVHQR